MFRNAEGGALHKTGDEMRRTDYNALNALNRMNEAAFKHSEAALKL